MCEQKEKHFETLFKVLKQLSITVAVLFSGIRVRWTEDEINILKKAFSGYFTSLKCPDASSIESAIRNYPVLAKRSKPQIKSRVWDLIKKQ